MDTSHTAERKDKILELICSSTEIQFNSHNIQKHLFPEIEKDLIKLWMEDIQNYHLPIVDIRNRKYDLVLCCNALTRIFLCDGGFTKLSDDNYKENKHVEERKNLELRALEGQIKLNVKNNRLIFPLFIISVLTLIASLFAIYIQFVSK